MADAADWSQNPGSVAHETGRSLVLRGKLEAATGTDAALWSARGTMTDLALLVVFRFLFLLVLVLVVSLITWALERIEIRVRLREHDRRGGNDTPLEGCCGESLLYLLLYFLVALVATPKGTAPDLGLVEQILKQLGKRGCLCLVMPPLDQRPLLEGDLQEQHFSRKRRRVGEFH
jgi:hypothetical protein